MVIARIVDSPRLRYAGHPSLLRKEGCCGVSSFFLFLFASFSPLYEVERGWPSEVKAGGESTGARS